MRTVSLAVGLFLVLGLVPLTGPSPAAATSHEESLDDPPADTFPFFSAGGAGLGLPDNMFSKEVDILRAFVGNETATEFELGLQVAGFDPTREATTDAQAPRYQISFELSSDANATWTVTTGGCFLGCGDDYLFGYWSLCRRDAGGDSPEADQFGSECWGVGWPMSFDRATGTIVFPLDREVMGQLSNADPPNAGDTVTVTGAFTQGAGFVADDLGEGTLEFAFASDTANQKLGLDFVTGDEEDEDTDSFTFGYVWKPTQAFGVAPGGQVVLPLAVDNRLGSKKIVDLAVDLEAADGSVWNLSYPEQLVVPGNDRIVANLVVGAKEGVAHRAYSRITVRATPLGDDAPIGMATAFVQATVTPSPASNVVHFHSVRQHCVGLGGLEETLYLVNPEMWACDWGALNVLDQDPTYQDADVPVLGPDSGRGMFWAALDTPLAQDLRFDLEQQVVVDVSMVARHVTQTVRVTANLFVGETHVGGAAETVDLDANPQTVPIAFTPRLDEETVSALEGGLYVVLEFDAQGVGSPPWTFFGSGSSFATVAFRPADSKITLPLLPLAHSEIQVSSGDHLVSLDLKEGKDPEEYVNPGRGLLFNVSLGNQGTTNDTVLLSLNKSEADGWLVTLAPTKKYKLAAGEYANATVVVRAPQDAKEGDRVSFGVLATSLEDPESKATMRLTVIATKGIEIPDETFEPTFGVTSGKSKKKDSPGASPLLALALVGAALVAAARRRKPD